MAAAPVSVRRARPLLGTFVEVAAAGEAFDKVEAAVEAAFAAVAMVHQLMSFHDADSDVSRLNRDAAAGAVEVHAWTFEVLRIAVDLHRRSAGAFDICIAPVLQRMGLLPDVPGLGVPSPDDGPAFSPSGTVHDLVRLLPGNKVRFATPAVKIDLGGIAKGFAVDCATEALQGHGIMEGIVNAGGDLRGVGPRTHAVDIRNPRQPDRTIFHVALRSGALASSAGRFDPALSYDVLPSAVIDPSTAMPAQVSGATVCAATCVIADALTKVVMNAGADAGTVLDHYSADALFVSSHGEAHMTANWKNEVYLAA